MENNNSITPQEVPKLEQEKKLKSLLGVGHYAHILSSFTNVMIAAFMIFTVGAFFVIRLVNLLQQSMTILSGGTSGTLLMVFMVTTLIISLGIVMLASLTLVESIRLRKQVKEEVSQENLVATAKKQRSFALIVLVITTFLFVGELLIPIFVVPTSQNGLIGTLPPRIWLFTLPIITFMAFGLFVITNNNLKANKKGTQYYISRPVEAIGRLEHFYIGIGNGAKATALMLFDIVMLFAKTFINIFVGFYKIIILTGKKTYAFLKHYVSTFINHSYRTKLSFFFMGLGHSFMRRPFKTIMYLLMQVGYVVFMLIPGGGIYWLSKFDNLGDVAVIYEYTCQIPGLTVEACPENALVQSQAVFQDNSMLITLYSVATILLTLAIIMMYWISIKGVASADEKFTPAIKQHQANLKDYKFDNVVTNLEQQVKNEVRRKPRFKNPIPTFVEELKQLLNARFHLTTLSVPALTITVFTFLPLVFMILLAFTNYNADNGPPNTLFTWVGLQTFAQLFTSVGGSNFATAFADIIQWTFIWAFFATLTNYVFGLLLAMVINKKGIKLKKLWRTAFVITIAVPQFVTLLLMSRLLDKYGPINQTLLDLGWITKHIEFLTKPTNAKISVILVNVWVGVPYTMLITSGILMNIPADLYESARIDGAGPIAQFMKITMPYMLFVTGPYLITQFIGNINNFNVIFFLTRGGPSANVPGVPYGKTDILVTWLYNLTVGGAQQQYSIGSALGIFIFLISVFITLSLYSKTSAATQEGDFA